MHQLDISLASLQEPQSQLLLFYLPIFSALLLHLLSQFREPGSREIFWPMVLANIYQTHFIKTHWNETLSTSVSLSLRSTGIFVLTIWSSMLIYRLGFHRLNKFKGPLKFIASKWFMVPVDLKGQRPYVMQKLHEKYGDIVRIGPRELSINDPEALSAIYGATGPSSRALRGPFYAFTKESTECGAYNLQSTPTMSDHAVRRKNWDAGFSAKALRGYEECVTRNVNLTISQINKQGKDENVKIDVGRWCSWFGFDVMGELGFGKGFDMVKNATTCRPIELIEEAVVLIMAIGNVPYMPALLKPIPTPIVALERWARNALKERLAGQTNNKIIEHDVFSHILGETKKSGNGKELSMDELTADAGLLVVAGSDTSSNTMCLALFHLIHTPGAYARLQEEIEHCFPGSVADDLNRLGKECDYLNAVIQETLRLWPPVASGLQRITPPEGIPLKSGVHIPGGIVVSTPTYVMHRDPRNFSHPNEFRPDRWMDSSEETEHNVKAFSAFGFGPTGCIGKQVGLMELRLLIARFVQTFDAKFAPGFDPQSFMDSIKDCFVLIKDPCWINVKPRSVELANAH